MFTLYTHGTEGSCETYKGKNGKNIYAMETTTYINSFDSFIQEYNRILVEDDPVANANHILIFINGGKNFGLLCASKPTETISGNLARIKKLQQDVMKLKCSYIPFKYGLSYASTGESVVRRATLMLT
jgi:hypothetical protein